MRVAPLALLLLLLPLPAGAQQVLDRPVSLDVRDLPLGDALLRLRQRGVAIAWSGDQIPHGHRVTLTLHDVPLGTLLRDLLRGTRLTPVVASSGTVVLITASPPRADERDNVLRATGVQVLDQLIVTGTAVGRTPERDQPVSVTVVTRDDLTAAPHHRLTDAMRAYLPGLVLWDRGGAGVVPQIAAVRGVASFTSRAPKIYVDGIEVASPALFTLVDARAVERVELINGPQGAALYGPDALNGVMQIDTRKGQVGGATMPRGNLVAGGLGRADETAQPWGEAAAGLSAGWSRGGLDLLGSVSRIGTDVVLAESWRMHAGAQHLREHLALTASVRAASHAAPLEHQVVGSTAIARREIPPLREAGGGITVTHEVSRRVVNAFTVGVHHISGAREPFRSPILPPVLPLGATNEDATRASARHATSVDFGRADVSVGAEASWSRRERTARAAGTSDLSALYDEVLAATGVFTQARLRVGRLTLSAGGRVERLSSDGVRAEAPWAATAGASWSQPVGTTTLRLRAAWGSALRPPEPGMSQVLAAGTVRQEANPSLTAERQDGFEIGAEAHFSGGAWIRATWFRQRADDLIQQVDLRRPIGTTRFYQFQNAGAITNRGIEFDGGVTIGRVSAAARIHFVDSRVAELSATYSGEFEPGDHPLEVPDMMGSAAVRYATTGATIEAGATWLGAWTGYDWRLIQRVEQGQAPARDRARDYWLRYDGVMRPFVGVQLAIRRDMTAWVRAEWPAGTGLLRDNVSPPAARTLLLGIDLNR